MPYNRSSNTTTTTTTSAISDLSMLSLPIFWSVHGQVPVPRRCAGGDPPSLVPGALLQHFRQSLFGDHALLHHSLVVARALMTGVSRQSLTLSLVPHHFNALGAAGLSCGVAAPHATPRDHGPRSNEATATGSTHNSGLGRLDIRFHITLQRRHKLRLRLRLSMRLRLRLRLEYVWWGRAQRKFLACHRRADRDSRSRFINSFLVVSTRQHSNATIGGGKSLGIGHSMNSSQRQRR